MQSCDHKVLIVDKNSYVSLPRAEKVYKVMGVKKCTGGQMGTYRRTMGANFFLPFKEIALHYVFVHVHLQNILPPTRK